MQCAQYAIDLVGALVFASWPEEAFEAVALLARNDVHVKMRDALAHTIVGSYKCPFRMHAQLDSDGQHSHIGE